MLPSSRRVTRALFPSLKVGARVVHGSLFTLRYVPSVDAISPSRFSVVVSKAVGPTAVQRNLMKRRARHAIIELLPRVKNGYMAVFFAKQPAAKASFAAYSKEIAELLTKTALLS